MSHLGHGKKRTFVLKSVDVTQINSKYGLLIISNIEKESENSTKTTRITDIINDTEHSISFLDENKKNYNTCVTMLEVMQNQRLPMSTDLHCYWCRHSFTTRPIGCPIKYVNSTIEKSYLSHITKDRYYMRENLTKQKMDAVMNQQIPNITISPIENNYYLTDGVFCSFNCALSFVKDNNDDLFYKDSYSLLHSMYHDFTSAYSKIVPAPHWRLLKTYGGQLTIEEFRKSFYLIDYEFMFNVRDIKEISEMRTISKVYRQHTLL